MGFSSDYNDYKKLKIYPNPVVDILHIKKSHQLGIIYITNIFGKIVYKNKGNITQIDVSDFAPGLYILKTIDKNDLEIKQKFIIK